MNRRLPVLLSVLAVLLLLAIVFGVFDRNPSTLDVPEVDIPVDELSSIRFGGSMNLALERSSGVWRLTEPVSALADSSTVSRFLESLSDVAIASVVSTQSERHARYGVDSSGALVDLSLGDERMSLVVSSTGPDFQSSYLRIGDGDAVYATRQRMMLPTDADRWRDRGMLENVTVVRANVTTPDAQYAVEPSPGGWSIRMGGSAAPADSAAVGRWLERFRSLRADGFHADLIADSIRAGASHRVVLTTTDGRSIGLDLLEVDGSLAVTLDDREAVHRLFSSRLASLVPDPESLAPAN